MFYIYVSVYKCYLYMRICRKVASKLMSVACTFQFTSNIYGLTGISLSLSLSRYRPLAHSLLIHFLANNTCLLSFMSSYFSLPVFNLLAQTKTKIVESEFISGISCSYVGTPPPPFPPMGASSKRAAHGH